MSEQHEIIFFFVKCLVLSHVLAVKISDEFEPFLQRKKGIQSLFQFSKEIFHTVLRPNTLKNYLLGVYNHSVLV